MSKITDKRDRLLNQIEDRLGIQSVGVCRRHGRLALLVLVEDQFVDLGFSTFEGTPVVVELADEGKAYMI